MIERSYLSWVSGEQYVTPEHFIAEARERGVTLRICNPGMAYEISKQGTVLYFAHNRQGRESRVCYACSEVVTCPECHGRGLARGEKCSRCLDHGVIERGTGGWVMIDGERMHYTQYIRMRRQPKHPFWDTPRLVGAVSPCKQCGGRGRVPLGAVFAAGVPTEVIIVTKDGKRPRIEAQITRGFEVLSEKEARKRWPIPRSHRRMIGGLWAIISGNGECPPLINEVIERLNGRAKAYGSFLELLDPVMIRDKQFMALKRWGHPAIDNGDE